jgi:hypothetical protein
MGTIPLLYGCGSPYTFVSDGIVASLQQAKAPPTGGPSGSW